MTEFRIELRHYCRNPLCRSKLPAPVANPREAFCTRGCHSSFHLHRCLICEQPMKRRTGNQRICGKRRCRNALQANNGLGRYSAPSSAILTQVRPDFIGAKQATKADRPWRAMAGPPSTPSQLHCATVPDGPSLSWSGGEYERIEAKNRAALKEIDQAEFTEPE